MCTDDQTFPIGYGYVCVSLYFGDDFVLFTMNYYL